MRMALAGIALGVAVIAVCAYVAQARTTEDGSTVDTTITITVGDDEFIAGIENNAASAAWLRMLPLTIPMREYNGNEKYYALDDRLPVHAVNPGHIRSGELMLFGSSTLVLFYEDFPTSYRYTRLGRIANPAGLKKAVGKGDVEVTFAFPERREVPAAAAASRGVFTQTNF